MNPDEPNNLLPNNARRMLAQVGLLIDLLEARLKDLEALERTQGSSTEDLRRTLRSRVRACYTVRLGLVRGKHLNETDLDRLVSRVQVDLEHRRYRAQPPISREEVAACDVDQLMGKLLG